MMAEVRLLPTQLEKAFQAFATYMAEVAEGEPFRDFGHPAIERHENYKKSLFNDAQDVLDLASWLPGRIGGGEYRDRVLRTMKLSVRHGGRSIPNNLLNWRNVGRFSERADVAEVEEALFDLYVRDVGEATCFARFEVLDLPYQLIAYLFFLKDRHRYLPITQRRFDGAFEVLCDHPFRTSHERSHANYSTFLSLVQEAQAWLQERLGAEVDLLDAHSFLYTYGALVDPHHRKTPGAEAIKEEFSAELFPEGKESFYLHRQRERDPALVRKAKELFIRRDPLMRCEVCGFSFLEQYGKLGEGYIEAHHTTPVSQMKPGHQSKVSDLVMVCSNCHVMLHRRKEPLPHDKLRRLLAGEGEH